MKPEKKDFDKEAAQWDVNPGRVKLANEVADAMIRELKPVPDMDALDFGCGTGLVTLRLQPYVKTITGADSSMGMLGVLRGKVEKQGINNVLTQFIDFEKGGGVSGKFHLIVSSMTLHHVPDTASLFRQWHELLHPGGWVCFADLDSEDGSFHGDNTGVFHLGFDRERLKKLLHGAGFREISCATATTMTREVEGKGTRDFPVFLMAARK